MKSKDKAQKYSEIVAEAIVEAQQATYPQTPGEEKMIDVMHWLKLYCCSLEDKIAELESKIAAREA